MLPCHSCNRHIYADEPNCPFCATPLSFTQAESRNSLSSLARVTTLAVTVALGSVAWACSTDTSAPLQESSSSSQTSAAAETSTSTSTTSTTNTTTETTQGSTMGTEDSATEDDSQSSGSFYGCAWDGDIGLSECDPFFQDCPEGEKCVPYAARGEGYSANKCVQITGDQQLGEDCIYSDPIAGTDDCAANSICLPHAVNGTNTCTEFCAGTFDNPVCPAETACFVAYEDSWTLCLPSCNPLLQDCEDADDICTSLDEGNFFCLPPEPAAVDLGQACEGPLDCNEGMCLDSEFLLECEGERCCTAWCDLDAPDCAPGLTCEGYYEEGMEPPGLATVGLCTAVLP